VRAPFSAAREAVDLMERHGLDPSPAAFAVLSVWKTGTHPDLSRALDAHVDSGQELSAAFIEDLHQRFFSGAELAVQAAETGSKIIEEIQGVVKELEVAGSRQDAYGERLSDTKRALERDLEPGRLSALLSSLARSTSEMISQNKKLTDRLNETSKEMGSLKEALDVVRNEALTDTLTGLSNRRSFEDVLKLRMAEADAFGTPLSLILCDIDHFKRFNDTWGHQTGDQVLRFIAANFMQQALSDYTVSRIGGEEFALILPRTSREDAKVFAETVRKSVERKKLLRRSTAEELGLVTVSSGVAEMRGKEALKDFFDRADRCLYASKHAGRNCVTSDEHMPTAAPAAEASAA
jgi:diguanylate cyclase